MTYVTLDGKKMTTERNRDNGDVLKRETLPETRLVHSFRPAVKEKESFVVGKKTLDFLGFNITLDKGKIATTYEVDESKTILNLGNWYYNNYEGAHAYDDEVVVDVPYEAVKALFESAQKSGALIDLRDGQWQEPAQKAGYGTSAFKF